MKESLKRKLLGKEPYEKFPRTSNFRLMVQN